VTSAELADWADNPARGYGRFSYLPGNTLLTANTLVGAAQTCSHVRPLMMARILYAAPSHKGYSHKGGATTPQISGACSLEATRTGGAYRSQTILSRAPEGRIADEPLTDR
jgi:hypothetical protein